MPQRLVTMALASVGGYDEALRRCDERLGAASPSGFGDALASAAVVHDWARYDRYLALSPPGQPLTPVRNQTFFRFLRNLRNDDRSGMQAALADIRQALAETGTVTLNALSELSAYGMYDEAFELVDQASFEHMFDPSGLMPSVTAPPSVIFDQHLDGGLPHDPRFLRLAAKIGLVAYWLETDRWPDCAAQAPYDFRAEARRLAGPAVRPDSPG